MSALTTASILRAVWDRHAAKHVARAIGGSVASAKPWVSGRRTPSADVLLRMAAESAELRAELIRRLEAHGYYQPVDAQMARARAAAARRPAGEAGGPAGPAVTWDGIDRRRGERRGG